ncbi:MAG: DNA translocase FtsK [Anaerolineae bacterium]|jgi:S-DNA-T family DNA segregation ATPase FtsK/SpoIIIE
MAKQPSKKQAFDWQALLADPKFRQMLQWILALLVFAVGVITLLALLGVTRGKLVDPWIGLLRRLFGWGVIPITVAILAAGLLWLAHYLDHPITWRWRPFVGVELAFFSLLGLTHTVASRDDPFALVDRGLDGSLFCYGSGGLVGWAINVTLRYSIGLGLWLTMLFLIVVLGLGLGLVFDVTFADIKQVWAIFQGRLAERQERQPKLKPKPSAQREQARPLQPVRSAPAAQAPAPARPEPVLQKVVPPPPPPPSVTITSPVPTVADEAAPPVVPAPLPREYTMPEIDLLEEPEGPVMSDEELREKSRIIKDTLGQFGLEVDVTEVRVGPTVTQFGVSPGQMKHSSRKVRVNQISTLADDLALALAAPRLRVEAPVPGRPIVGIEVPNSKVQLVGVREVMDTEEFRKLNSPLAITLGRDVAGEPVVADLARMPHLLIAGTTGSGKSVCIKTIITCLIYNNTPEDLRLVMIDPKMVELIRFNGLPHLYGRVEVDLERVVKVLRWVAMEMDKRYKLFADATARNLDDYNRMMKKEGRPRIPRIAVLVDELADLMMLAPDEVEKTICRIAQMARATGIHLVMATQRPSVDVVTGLIKANFPARISFATVSQTDSRVILDMPGAETLLGNGDMLYLAADAGYPVRVQGCFVSEEEVEEVVSFWHDQVGMLEEEAPWERMMRPEERDSLIDEHNVDEDLLQQAIAVVQKEGEASASLLQRRLRIGHPRAARLIQVMEEMGIVGPQEAAGRTRRVIGGEY